MVKKDIDRPARWLVTASTILSQSILMDIVHPVTTETNNVERQVQGATGMTNPAIQIRMCTNQWKISVSLVIEGGVRPLSAVMASTAVGTVAALVNVVSEVTGSTFRGQWRIIKAALMTAGAGYLRMPALKCEAAGFRMVKCRLFPVFSLMALFAVLAILAFMVIVELMA